MIAIVCVDDREGMAFNGRRQSRDRTLRAVLMSWAGPRPLWMNAYSAGQFEPEYAARIQSAEDFLDRAGPGELCFVEDRPLLPCRDKLEQLVLFRWNRIYPADVFLDLSPEQAGLRPVCRRDFAGFSHKVITQEVYVR